MCKSCNTTHLRHNPRSFDQEPHIIHTADGFVNDYNINSSKEFCPKPYFWNCDRRITEYSITPRRRFPVPSRPKILSTISRVSASNLREPLDRKSTRLNSSHLG